MDNQFEHLIVQAALKHQHDMWANCVTEGIEQEILIDATLAMAIREAIRLQGEDATEAMLNEVRDRIITGEFSPERILQ